MITYQATTEKYDPSDGVSADLGALDLRNVLVVSEDGEEGNLVASITNTGEDDATLEIVSLGAADEEPLLIENLGAEVGGLVAMYFQHGAEEGLEIQVPVLDGGLPEYEDLVP